jgi:hypothetical protein
MFHGFFRPVRDLKILGSLIEPKRTSFSRRADRASLPTSSPVSLVHGQIHIGMIEL